MLLLRALPVLAVLGSLLWSGYKHRRGVWTRRSWLRFGVLLTAAVGTVVVAMSMATAVDRGVYEGMALPARRLYFCTLMTLAIAGPLATVSLLLWFARGRPERQLG